MRLPYRERTPSVLIAETAVATMTAAAKESHPEETGGILIGVLADGAPWITQAIELPSTDRGLTHYRLPPGTTRLVHAARHTDPRLGYLGDWHSHPTNVSASDVDLSTLRSLTRISRDRPTLVVLRNTGELYEIDAIRQGWVTRKGCTITLTGDLGPG